jgi:hypothetical protein
MLKYRIIIGLLSFALGATAVLAIQNYKRAKDHNIVPPPILFLERCSNEKMFSFFICDYYVA